MSVFTYDYLEKNGRLGNQLWQIAATINFAEQQGGIARFRPDWEYRPYFSVPDEYFEPYSSGLNRIDGDTNYFQEYSYFEPIAHKIRSYFAPSEMASKEIASRWDDTSDYHTCAIHVRRGDYLKYPGHFPITSSRFYQTAVADIKERNPDTVFFVFSDDILWCGENQDYFGCDNSLVVFVEGTVRPVEVVDRIDPPLDWLDLFFMTNLDDHIISNSTFAWWGAYLSNNRKPIYPSKWFNSQVPNYKRWELAMPEGWRKFEC